MNAGWPIRLYRSTDKAAGHFPPQHISHRKSVGCGGRDSRFSGTSFNICRRFRISATALHFSSYQIRRMLLTKAAWVSLVIIHRNRLKFVYWRLLFFLLGYLTGFVVSYLLDVDMCDVRWLPFLSQPALWDFLTIFRFLSAVNWR